MVGKWHGVAMPFRGQIAQISSFGGRKDKDELHRWESDYVHLDYRIWGDGSGFPPGRVPAGIERRWCLSRVDAKALDLSLRGRANCAPYAENVVDE